MIEKFFLICGLILTPQLYADDGCVTSNSSLSMLQQTWQQSDFPIQKEITQDKSLFTVTLLPLDKAKEEYGEVTVKSKKNISALRKIGWLHVNGGDYWIASDSAVWLDIINRNGSPASEPVEIERSLRCAGIHKALRFSIHAGDYDLVIASELQKPVRIAVHRVTN